MFYNEYLYKIAAFIVVFAVKRIIFSFRLDAPLGLTKRLACRITAYRHLESF